MRDILKNKKTPQAEFFKERSKNGAGDGNRTHIASLEGWSFTTKLHLQVVGKTGFEPATSWSQTKRSTKLSHFPIRWRTQEDSNSQPFDP